jgi:hypothetical protein
MAFAQAMNEEKSQQRPVQGKRAEQTFLLHDCKEKKR